MEEYDYDDTLLPGRSQASGDSYDQDDGGDNEDHEEEDWGDEDGWGNEITVGEGGKTVGGGRSEFGVWDYEEGRKQESVDEAAAIAAAEAEEIDWS